MSEAPPTDKEKLALNYAVESRKSEIALLWSRSLYFWGFIAVVLVAYSGAFENGHKNLALIAVCFGIICSLCWTLVNRSSKYWQRIWEVKTERLAIPVVGDMVFPRTSNLVIEQRWFWGAKEYSPSKLATAVSDSAVVAWIALAGAAFSYKRLVFDLFVVTMTAAYALVILLWCRSGDPMTLKQAGDAVVYRAKLTSAALRRLAKP